MMRWVPLAVHGFCGAYGVILVGVFASTYPNVGDLPDITFTGQLIGAIVMALTGFIPGWGISWVMKKMNALRVPPHVEVLGLDLVEIPAKPYPESLPAHVIVENTLEEGQEKQLV